MPSGPMKDVSPLCIEWTLFSTTVVYRWPNRKLYIYI